MSEDTTTLYWPRETDFVDYRTDARYRGSGVYEVPAGLESFYRHRGWEDVPDDHEGEAGGPISAINRNLDGPSRDQMESVTTGGDDEGGN